MASSGTPPAATLPGAGIDTLLTSTAAFSDLNLGNASETATQSGLEILPHANTGFYNADESAPFHFFTVDGNFWATGTFHVSGTASESDPMHAFQNAGILARDPNGENWVAVEIGKQATQLGYLFKSTHCRATDSNTQHAGWRNGDLFLCRDGSNFVAYVRPESCPAWFQVAPPIPDTGFPHVMQVGVMAGAYDSLADNRTHITRFAMRTLGAMTCVNVLAGM